MREQAVDSFLFLAGEGIPPRVAVANVREKGGAKLDANVIWELLREADLHLATHPRTGLALSMYCLYLLREIPKHPCFESRVLGVVGIALMYKNKLLPALTLVEKAIAASGDCNRCLVDMYPRRAHIQLLMKNFNEAMGDANRSLQLSEEMSDDDLIGRSRYMRATVWFYGLRDVDKAIADGLSAIKLLSRKSSAKYLRSALSNATVFLSASGSLRHMAKALALMPAVHASFRGVDEESVEKKKVRWVHAMLLARVNQAEKALGILNKLWVEFIDLELAHETISLFVDIAILEDDDEKIDCRYQELVGLNFIADAGSDLLEAVSHLGRSLENREKQNVADALMALREIGEEITNIPASLFRLHPPVAASAESIGF